MYLYNCIYTPIYFFLKKDCVQQCETFYSDSIHWGEIKPKKRKTEWKSFWMTVNLNSESEWVSLEYRTQNCKGTLP